MQTTNILELLAEHPDGSFLFANFNDASFSTCSIEGASPGWEMHPDTDEFFYIIEGEVQMTLLESSGGTLHRASAGSAFVVPQGVWHKPGAPDGAKFIYFTPGESLYSEADDPRNEN